MENQIILGDCLQIGEKVPDKSVDLIFTDLPYGVLNSRSKWDIPIEMDKLWPLFKRVLKYNGAVVLTATQPFSSYLINSNLDWFKYEWIWEKEMGTGFLNAKKQPLRNHEQILVFYNKQPTYNPQMREGKPYSTVSYGGESKGGTENYGDHKSVLTKNEGTRYPVTIIKYSRDKVKLHSTQKPLDLCKYIINTYSNTNDLVFDCCTGSGSICLAAKQLGRRYIGIEIDEKFHKIAEDRLNAYPL